MVDRRFWILSSLVVGVVSLAAACGGSDAKYYLPADSQMKPFVAPEAEDLVADGDDDDEDYGSAADDEPNELDESEETGVDDAAAPTPPGPAAVPKRGAAAPVGQPQKPVAPAKSAAGKRPASTTP